MVLRRRSWKRPRSTPTASRPKSGGPWRGVRGSPDMAPTLIVEDTPANLTLAVFLLQSVGHTVLTATDAETGLTLARDEHPHLILMDIQLPGMDGFLAVISSHL